MTYLLTIAILAGIFIIMSVGLLLGKKALQKGCSLGSDCTCKNEPQKSKDDCSHKS